MDLRNMRVVHLSCVAPPYHGGIGRVAVEEVSRLCERGVDAALLAPRVGAPVEVPHIIRPMSWNVYGNTAFFHPIEFFQAIRGADIVHLHYPFYGVSEQIPVFRLFGSIRKLVVTLHMDALPGGLPGAILGLHRRIVQPVELAAADVLLASSLDYIRYSSYARYAPSVLELPFGVDEVRFSPGPKDRAAFGVPADALVVSFLGGMDAPHAFKGVDVLLRALSELPHNVWCVLVGVGNLQQRYRTLAAELGVDSRVKFLGHLKDHQLPAFYRLADVHVVPSISGAEAFSLAAVEAQACGIPVVASDLPGVRTVVADKETGLLTPPGDAPELAAHLRLLLKNPDLCKTFGAAARARVLERFTWQRHMDGLMKVYQRVCE